VSQHILLPSQHATCDVGGCSLRWCRLLGRGSDVGLPFTLQQPECRSTSTAGPLPPVAPLGLGAAGDYELVGCAARQRFMQPVSWVWPHDLMSFAWQQKSWKRVTTHCLAITVDASLARSQWCVNTHENFMTFTFQTKLSQYIHIIGLSHATCCNRIQRVEANCFVVR